MLLFYLNSERVKYVEHLKEFKAAVKISETCLTSLEAISITGRQSRVEQDEAVEVGKHINM